MHFDGAEEIIAARRGAARYVSVLNENYSARVKHVNEKLRDCMDNGCYVASGNCTVNGY